MADGVGVPPPKEIKGLHWQTGQGGRFDTPTLFARLANLKGTGDPPEKETAAPIGKIGSGGNYETELVGTASETEEYFTARLTATPPRIIATHWGDQ